MADLSLQLASAAQGTPAYGDLLLLNGRLVLTQDADPDGTQPVLQQVLQRMRTFLGEWFLDNRVGTPWLQQILTKDGAGASADAILQNVILGTPGVTALLDYEADFDRARRTLRLRFRAQSTAGVVDYASTLAPLDRGDS